MKAGSLRAGTQCCVKDPDLHFRAPGVPFQQAAPTFTEDIAIPWEGRRLLDTVKRASAKVTAGQEVRLVARVSEGPEQRRKLEAQLKEMLAKAGADPAFPRATTNAVAAERADEPWHAVLR